MKKDGIQTRNRKLAAKAKKRRMHDFFKPLDPRFGAYGGMGGMGVSSFGYGMGASVATNPMSQYYAANTMGAQMSQFMSPSSMAHMAAASVGADPTHQRGGFDSLSQDNLGLHQSLGGGSGHHHQHSQDSPTSSASAMMASNSPTSPDIMGSSQYNNSAAAAAAAAAAAMSVSAYSWNTKDAVSAAAALSSSSESQQQQQQHPSSSSPSASSAVVTPTSMVGASA